MFDRCTLCCVDYYDAIAKFYENNDAALEFLREHGCLPSAVKCPKCDNNCTLVKEENKWECRNQVKTKGPCPKKHKTSYSCGGYSVSDFKDTFMHSATLPAWKIILYVNHWLSHLWEHQTVVRCLDITLQTSNEYKAFCNQVTNHWFDNQESVGGPGFVVEVDKTCIQQQRKEWARFDKQIWLFGGVERGTLRKFIVPLVGPVGDWQEHSTVLPLVKRFVRTGTVVISDQWGAYHGLSDQGYTHYIISPAKTNQTQGGVEVHTRNIHKLWKELQNWFLRPRVKISNLYQDLGKHLFLKTQKDYLLHSFFDNVRQLFSLQSGQRRACPLEDVTLKEEEVEDLEAEVEEEIDEEW